MKTEQIIILVVAFFLGMLLLNMVKNVCGCDVVEGLSAQLVRDSRWLNVDADFRACLSSDWGKDSLDCYGSYDQLCKAKSFCAAQPSLPNDDWGTRFNACNPDPSILNEIQPGADQSGQQLTRLILDQLTGGEQCPGGGGGGSIPTAGVQVVPKDQHLSQEDMEAIAALATGADTWIHIELTQPDQTHWAARDKAIVQLTNNIPSGGGGVPLPTAVGQGVLGGKNVRALQNSYTAGMKFGYVPDGATADAGSCVALTPETAGMLNSSSGGYCVMTGACPPAKIWN